MFVLCYRAAQVHIVLIHEADNNCHAGLYYPSDYDATNTTAFVGNVNADITEDDLYNIFSRSGEILSVKLLVEKECAFITYATKDAAERAIHHLHGKVDFSCATSPEIHSIVCACVRGYINWAISILMCKTMHVSGGHLQRKQTKLQFCKRLDLYV